MNQEINDNARIDQNFYIEDSENTLAQFQTHQQKQLSPQKYQH